MISTAAPTPSPTAASNPPQSTTHHRTPNTAKPTIRIAPTTVHLPPPLCPLSPSHLPQSTTHHHTPPITSKPTNTIAPTTIHHPCFFRERNKVQSFF
ncbi:hypothetical protein Hanom_Chr12g01115171 [Helianthus anomalus]